MSKPRIVIVGAGFGGLAAARRLSGEAVDVLLVDRNNFHTFQPLLYQVATAGLNATDVGHPVRGLFQDDPTVDFRQAEVVGVDWVGRQLHLDRGGRQPFDHLVVAAGARSRYFGIPGAEEHTLPLYTLDDSVRLRNHVLSQFEDAAHDPGRLTDGTLTFVVVGGGPTGIETAGALVELFDHVLRKDYRHLDLRRTRVVLVEREARVLGTFKESSGRYAAETLRSRGVELRLGVAVEAIDATGIDLSGGDRLDTRTVIWAAGVEASPLAERLELPTGAGGRIVVGPDLSVPRHRGVWAVGDVALALDGHGRPLPQMAPVAMQAGDHVARQILRASAGQPTQPFRYTDKGAMATIGRRSAVAELPFGLRLRGTAAWIAWLVLHLLYLVGQRNRASVLLNWAWSYVTWDRGPRLILRPHQTRSRS